MAKRTAFKNINIGQAFREPTGEMSIKISPALAVTRSSSGAPIKVGFHQLELCELVEAQP